MNLPVKMFILSKYGVLRGLHFQRGAHAQSKLVRVVRGRVLDVAVDIRRGSPTFGRHVSVELSGDNKRQFFVPRGFAHGFSVLSDEAVFQYKCDNLYAPESELSLIHISRSNRSGHAVQRRCVRPVCGPARRTRRV